MNKILSFIFSLFKLVLKALIGIYLLVFFCILTIYVVKFGIFLFEMKIEDITSFITLTSIVSPYQVIILIFIAFVIYLFRYSIRMFLERVTAIQIPGIGTIQASETQNTPPKESFDLDTNNNSKDDIIEKYHKRLEELNKQYNFEWILNEIMGTQLLLLEQLYDNAQHSIFLVVAQQYYYRSCQEQRVYPNSYTQDRYFGFLVQSGLISIDFKSGIVSLTPLGQEVVFYKRKNHMGIQRPF